MGCLVLLSVGPCVCCPGAAVSGLVVVLWLPLCAFDTWLIAWLVGLGWASVGLRLGLGWAWAGLGWAWLGLAGLGWAWSGLLALAGFAGFGPQVGSIDGRSGCVVAMSACMLFFQCPSVSGIVSCHVGCVSSALSQILVTV